MNTRFFVTLMIVATAISAGAAIPGAAQAGENRTNTTLDALEGENCQDPEAINDELVLCSADYEDGEVTLRFRADSLTRIVLTDSGAVMKGGHVPQRRVLLRSEEVNKVTWKVTEYEGNAGVVINHDDGLYSVPLEDPFVFVGGPWGSGDAQLAALSGAIGVGAVSIVVVLRGVLGRDQEPERVA